MRTSELKVLVAKADLPPRKREKIQRHIRIVEKINRQLKELRQEHERFILAMLELEELRQ